MAIKISNTTVIDNSRGLQNITNLKTVSGNNILGTGDISVSLSSGVTGTLPVANGGTGITSAGAAGNVLTSNGTTWVSQSQSLPSGKAYFFSSF